jgi:predicted dehydrogenase
LKFLIAGFGSIGRRHLRNLLALGEEDIVLLRSKKSTLPEDEISGIPQVMDIQSALDFHPDAVIVANPTALHLDVAIPAAQAGCHILMEKPISNSSERLDILKSALDEKGGKLLVGFQFRFHPGLQKVNKLLKADAIGRPISFRVQWGEYLPNWHPWEDYRKSYSARQDLGGGVVLTLSHPLDYLGWLFGDVAGIFAFEGKMSDLDLQVEDTAEIMMHFKKDVTGSLHLDFCQQPPSHKMEIIGTSGTLLWDNADGAARIFQAAKGKWESFELPAGFERNDLFLAELRHFIQVMRGEVEPICGLEDGEKVMNLVSAAHLSAKFGRLVEI